MKVRFAQKGMTFALIITLLLGVFYSSKPVSVYAMGKTESVSQITFSNSDFLAAASQAMERGEISHSQYQVIASLMTDRFGVYGENKIVSLGNDIYEYYLNSVTWAAIVAVGTLGIAPIINLIPGFGPAVSKILTPILSSVLGNVSAASRGVIIRVQMVDTPNFEGLPTMIPKFISIREQ